MAWRGTFLSPDVFAMGIGDKKVAVPTLGIAATERWAAGSFHGFLASELISREFPSRRIQKP